MVKKRLGLREGIGLLVLFVLAVIGAAAIFQRLQKGLAVTALTSNVPWGMWVAYYIYCIGLSAGSFLLSTVIYVFGMTRFEKMGRMALLSALFALCAGMTFIWIDLGHPFRFYKIFTGWQRSSVLAWESLFYLFYIAAICLELWLLMRCDLDRLANRSTGWKKVFYRCLALRWRCPETPEGQEACHAQSLRWVKAIGIIGIPIAIGVHGGTGAIFAVVAAKPYWFSGLFPIIFLVSALLSGTGLMLALYAGFGRRDEDYEPIVAGLRDFLAIFIVIDLLLFFSDTLVGYYGAIPDHVEILHAIMFGDFWYVFWIGQIGLAWLLPLLITSLPMTRRNYFWLGTAGWMVVIGIIAVRLNIVIPAYLYPQLPGLDKIFVHPRLAYSYFPSLIEWTSSIGVFAAVGLVFIAACRLLPLYELTEEEGR
ncbi:MAG: molybdopterin oxidoreductase [Candidatus Hydrogenedentota bacterium]|nr:MAG: molybdopterin oxidoreductase [Candidatus Hydrogenedentota bacterium]